MSISVLNTDAGLSGKTILNAEDVQTISGNKTFSGNVTLTLVTSNLLFTDASYDIGASGATRPRDLWLSRNALIGGTLGVTGVLTPSGNVYMPAGTVLYLDSNTGLHTYIQESSNDVLSVIVGGNVMAQVTSTSFNMQQQGTVAAAHATPAGGSTSARLTFGTTAGFGIYIGSGAPAVSAAKGSLYLRSDGSSTSTRAYINTDGGTTWTAITTAA